MIVSVRFINQYRLTGLFFDAYVTGSGFVENAAGATKH